MKDLEQETTEWTDKSVHFLYLSQEDCIKAGGLNMEGTLEAIENSFLHHGRGEVIQPPKPVIRWGGPETEETRGRIMSMPSYIGGDLDVAGIKWIPSMPANTKKLGMPRASALIILNNPTTGFPLAVMDGTVVSAMRTGAASGIAAKYLAKDSSEVVGLIGAGVQSRTQLMALQEVLKSHLKLVKIFDLNEKKAKRFASEMSKELNVTIQVAKRAEDAIRDTDVFVTSTMSTFPYVKRDWVKKGALHIEISFWDTSPEEVKDYDQIIVDDWSHVKHHGVDVSYRAVEKGVIQEAAIKELGKIVVGKLKGRENAQERILFNPIGLSIHDVSEAYRVYLNALDKGIGKKLSLWENPIWT